MGRQRLWKDVDAAAQCMQSNASKQDLHFFFLSCTQLYLLPLRTLAQLGLITPIVRGMIKQGSINTSVICSSEEFRINHEPVHRQLLACNYPNFLHMTQRLASSGKMGRSNPSAYLNLVSWMSVDLGCWAPLREDCKVCLCVFSMKIVGVLHPPLLLNLGSWTIWVWVMQIAAMFGNG